MDRRVDSLAESFTGHVFVKDSLEQGAEPDDVSDGAVIAVAEIVQRTGDGETVGDRTGQAGTVTANF